MASSSYIEPRGGDHAWVTPGIGSSVSHWDRTADQSIPDMTLTEFVAKVFLREHVNKKKPAGQTHYRAILKHVLRPEEVDEIFKTDLGAPNRKLKSVTGWPYLGHMTLRETGPEDVQRLVSAALQKGYSHQTIKHIRNVVRTIYSHAIRKGCLHKENPADWVRLPEMIGKRDQSLTLEEAKEVLAALRHPAREMALIAILTGMKVGEICGLQWKNVNLTDNWIQAGGEQIPPKTIAVKNQWSLGKLVNVTGKSRNRTIRIPNLLVLILLELSRRPRFVGPDDFVLVSRAGRPVGCRHIAESRLKPVGRRLGIPWISWQILARTRKMLASEFSLHSQSDKPAWNVDSSPGICEIPPKVSQQFLFELPEF